MKPEFILCKGNPWRTLHFWHFPFSKEALDKVKKEWISAWDITVHGAPKSTPHSIAQTINQLGQQCVSGGGIEGIGFAVPVKGHHCIRPMQPCGIKPQQNWCQTSVRVLGQMLRKRSWWVFGRPNYDLKLVKHFGPCLRRQLAQKPNLKQCCQTLRTIKVFFSFLFLQSFSFVINFSWLFFLDECAFIWFLHSGWSESVTWC